jgi:hypothetical protein
MARGGLRFRAPTPRWRVQPVCKPSSVPRRRRGGDHLSRPDVTGGLVRPTRGLAGRPESLYLVLLQMGFARPACHHAAGALLPHHFTLARQRRAVCFCCAFRGVAPPGRYPASSPGGARTFLSALPRSGHPTGWTCVLYGLCLGLRRPFSSTPVIHSKSGGLRSSALRADHPPAL